MNMNVCERERERVVVVVVVGDNPRWPIPRKVSNKCEGGRRIQDFFGRAEKKVWCERWGNDFVIDCFMIDELGKSKKN